MSRKESHRLLNMKKKQRSIPAVKVLSTPSTDFDLYRLAGGKGYRWWPADTAFNPEDYVLAFSRKQMETQFSRQAAAGVAYWADVVIHPTATKWERILFQQVRLLYNPKA